MMCAILPVPQWFQYDLPGIFYFEVYPDGTVLPVSSKLRDVADKEEDSVYGSYFRIKNNECTLYLSTLESENSTIAYRVDDPERLADSFGIVRKTEHFHDIHAAFSPADPGTGRHAKIDIELCCGCLLCSSNKRIMREYLRNQFGWEIILSSIDSRPLSKRTIIVERKSLSKTTLPF